MTNIVEKENIDIFSEIKKLNLPPDQFIVIGSGILAAKNIRPCNDIDFIVTPELFEKLIKRGWKYEIANFFDGNSREKISYEIFEAFKDFWRGETVEDFINNPQLTEIINGIMFTSLDELIKAKQVWNREKDKKDLQLINDYKKGNKF